MEPEKKPPFRLTRVAIAATLAQLIPLIVLVATITVYSYLIAPNLDKEIYEEFATRIAKPIGWIAGTLATLGMAFWAARKAHNRQVIYGVATGALVVLLDILSQTNANKPFDLIDILVLVAKLMAGTLGGYLAWQRYRNLPAEKRHTHRLI
jgi:putative membrane protein (TIGR04086 family)